MGILADREKKSACKVLNLRNVFVSIQCVQASSKEKEHGVGVGSNILSIVLFLQIANYGWPPPYILVGCRHDC